LHPEEADIATSQCGRIYPFSLPSPNIPSSTALPHPQPRRSSPPARPHITSNNNTIPSSKMYTAFLALLLPLAFCSPLPSPSTSLQQANITLLTMAGAGCKSPSPTPLLQRPTSLTLAPWAEFTPGTRHSCTYVLGLAIAPGRTLHIKQLAVSGHQEGQKISTGLRINVAGRRTIHRLDLSGVGEGAFRTAVDVDIIAGSGDKGMEVEILGSVGQGRLLVQEVGLMTTWE
ncbi:hypothetical protein EJ06DRAFT_563995, partial [Trichodelitschia bisporula]